MINYRQIFNPNYTCIGLIIIIVIIILLLIINKNSIITINQISKTALIASIITISISLILKLLINTFIPTSYKIIIEIVSKNLITSIFTYSTIIAFISILALISTKILIKNKSINKEITNANSF